MRIEIGGVVRTGALGLFMAVAGSAWAQEPAPAAPAEAGSDGMSIRAAVFLGQKALDDDWDFSGDGVPDDFDFSKQLEFGVETTWDPHKFPVAIAADLFYSMGSADDEGIELSVSTMELGLGVRKFFAMDKITPYAGAGILYGSASSKLESDFGDSDDSESAIGFWAGGGALYGINDKLSVGAAVRYSSYEPEFEDDDIASGGLHYGLTLSYVIK